MNILVTGGLGFIGSHLVDALVDEGAHAVSVLDIQRADRSLSTNPQVRYITGDIARYGDVQLAIQQCVPEVVFHCAAQARIQASIVNPLRSYGVNSTGTFNVLEAARVSGVRRIIYSASSSAYGPQKSFPLVEDMRPVPQNPYAVDKYAGELRMAMYAALSSMQTVSLRYFNVYGPRQPTDPHNRYTTVIGKFLRLWKLRCPLTIVPDGHQRRDYTHVVDVVRANIAAMHSDRVGNGEVINIGTGKNYSVVELAELIGGQGYPSRFIEPREGEVRETLASIARAKTLLDWEPTIALPDGIERLKASL